MGAFIKLSGNLGKTIQAGKTTDGRNWLRFSIYQSHWKKSGVQRPDGTEEYVDDGGFWMDVSWFGDDKIARAGTILKTGAAVIVEGNLFSEQWTDKDTGEIKHAFKVIARDVTLDMKALDSVVYRRSENRTNNTPTPRVNTQNNTPAPQTGGDISPGADADFDDAPF
ncbi:MAG: single-stranded DNA-binding protein [Cardiobacteriaceae bacterium]|nr:single-stranded DNA-binding protein [Cardiobacteriaceae bacterium]